MTSVKAAYNKKTKFIIVGGYCRNLENAAYKQNTKLSLVVLIYSRAGYSARTSGTRLM